MDRQKEIEETIKNLQTFVEIHETILEDTKKRILELKSTPEPKEPETWEELNNEIGFNYSTSKGFNYPESDKLDFGVSLFGVKTQTAQEINNFAKRLLIADYCGRVDRKIGQTYTICITEEGVPDVGIFIVHALGDNHFPTEEAAEKYLRICQNSNLL